MKKPAAQLSFFTFLLLLLSGCTTTFAGTVLVLTFRDIVMYVVIALVISALVFFTSNSNNKRAFWISFILSIVLTPLAGLIYFLILLGRDNTNNS